MIDLAQSDALFFHPVECHWNGIRRAHSDPIAAVAKGGPLVGAHGVVGVHPVENGGDRKVKMLREFPIALVASWHGHDGPCAVTCKHVVGNPNRDQLARDRMHHVAACEHARDGFVALTVTFGLHARRFDVCLDFGALGV